MNLAVIVAYLVKPYIDALVRGNDSLWLLIIISGLLVVSRIGVPLSSFYIYELVLALRKGLSGLLFAKSLRLSTASVMEASSAKLMNICSGDMALIETYVGELSTILVGPLCILLVMGLLYQTSGATAFYGLAIALLFLAVQIPISALVLRLRLRIAQASDSRLSIVQTIVKGILTIKSSAWEAPLLSRVKGARK